MFWSLTFLQPSHFREASGNSTSFTLLLFADKHLPSSTPACFQTAGHAAETDTTAATITAAVAATATDSYCYPYCYYSYHFFYY